MTTLITAAKETTSKMTSLPFYGGLKHGTEAES